MARGPRTTTERVVEAVATCTDIDPLELPPLYDTIDPDSLEAGTRQMSDGEIQFRYAGCAVTVRSDGSVDIAGDSRSQFEQAESATDD